MITIILISISEPAAPKAKTKKYLCPNPDCGKRFTRLGNRNKHVWNNHAEYWAGGVLKRRRWVKRAEEQLKRDEYVARAARGYCKKNPVRVVTSNPRAKKPVGRPRKPNRPGRPRGPASALPS